MEDIFRLILWILSLFAGLIFGTRAERRHFESIEQREQQLGYIPATDLRSYIEPDTRYASHIVISEVVIATDGWKVFVAGLKNFFGGEVRSFQTLLLRARREALLRLKEQAAQHGYNALCNVRLMTADIGGTSERGGMAMVAVLASATAYHSRAVTSANPAPPPASPVVPA